MAKAQMYLDPNAQAYTDDEIVGKVNAATANITRASSVDAAARPIAAGEVGETELAANAVTNAKAATTLAKDNLDAMAEADRAYIKSEPASGQFKIYAVQRHSDGTFEADYEDVAEP